jgi:hypothetical protein
MTIFKKNANFSPHFFRRKYFQNHNIGPCRGTAAPTLPTTSAVRRGRGCSRTRDSCLTKTYKIKNKITFISM